MTLNIKLWHLKLIQPLIAFGDFRMIWLKLWLWGKETGMKIWIQILVKMKFRRDCNLEKNGDGRHGKKTKDRKEGCCQGRILGQWLDWEEREDRESQR